MCGMDDKLKAISTFNYTNNKDCVVYESIDLLGLDHLRAVMLQIQNESKSQGFIVMSMQTVAHLRSSPNIDHITSNISYWANRLSECGDVKSKDTANSIKLAIAAMHQNKEPATGVKPSQKQEVVALRHFLTSPAHFIEKMSREDLVLLSNKGAKKWRHFRQVPCGWSVSKSISMTSSQLLGSREKIMKILDEYDHISVFRYRKPIGHLLKSDVDNGLTSLM